jgi:hypothetical protein
LPRRIAASGLCSIPPQHKRFGNTKAPPRGKLDYTFDSLARVIGRFIEALELRRYALYVFDYGAPTGYSLSRLTRRKSVS